MGESSNSAVVVSADNCIYFSSLHPINIEALCLKYLAILAAIFGDTRGLVFEQFKEATNDEDLEDMLKDAQAYPKGMAAQDFLKKGAAVPQHFE